MSIYPPKVQEKFLSPNRAGKTGVANAVGTEASFVCGSFVRFYMDIDRGTKEIREIGYRSNGCGFMIASAEAVAANMGGKRLTDLHGLGNDWIVAVLDTELGLAESGRIHCRETCVKALYAAFADYRSLELEEFQGEKALVCTCFGVSEERIDQIIAEKSPESVDEVTVICSAGGGCGSCRMLIQEMIDSHKTSGAGV